jgi:hypothetical protein
MNKQTIRQTTGRAILALGFLAITSLAPSSSQAQTLKTQKFPDGSGQIGVVPGWKIDAAQGAVTLTGPGSAMMQLGQYKFVFAHNFDQQTLTPGVNPEVPRVHLDNPVRALIDSIAPLQKQGIISRFKIKAVEPASGFTGRAAFIRYSFLFQGKAMEAFGLFMIVATDSQSGSSFYSFVMAPTESFAKRLPEMNAMWQSWSLSPKLLKDRLDAATKIIGEIDMPGKLDSIQQERRKVALKAARDFQGFIKE